MPLPDPASRPGVPVVLFDGYCRMCQGQMRLIHALDFGNSLAYRSLHEPDVATRYPDLSFEQLMSEMWIIDRDQRRYGGARAVRFLSRHLPALWILAPLLHLPFSYPLWRSLYQFVARQRYRFGREACDGDSCRIHGY